MPCGRWQQIQIKNQDVKCKNIGGKERRESNWCEKSHPTAQIFGVQCTTYHRDLASWWG